MRFLSLFLITLLFSSLLSAAPTSVTTWKEAVAKAKSKNKDILMLVHGSNWNRLGEKFRHLIWEQPKFQNQLGGDILLFRVDFLDSPTEKEKKKFDAAVKGVNIKFPSYPVLALYDPTGKHYATWTGSDFPLMISQAVSIITHKQSQRKKRDAYILEAAGLKGVEKAKPLYQAVECDAGMRKELVKQIRACDPNNESGYLAVLEFDGKKAMGKANQLAKEKKFEEAIAWLDEQWKQPNLNTEQKQWILASKGNVYRRWGEDHLKEMNQAFRAAHDLDPKSIVGKASLKLAEKFYKEPLL